MTINVSDMITKTLETIEESSSVQVAARKMRGANVSSLVVVDNNGKPTGIVTERDIAYNC
jgi:predicted transcriptional regulator